MRGAAGAAGAAGMERESDSEEEEAAEAPAPAKRRKTAPQGAKAVPDAWRTTPSVPWPSKGRGATKGVRYHTEDDKGNRTYWLFDGKQRLKVCVCQKDGLCGVRAVGRVRPGYADVCATREDHSDQYMETKRKNGNVLPAFGGKQAHIGEEPAFVTHKGVDCVTAKSNGRAMKLCDCGECFKPCRTFSDTHAVGCLFNTAPKCKDCDAVARVGEYCGNCAQARNPTALRKAAQEPALQAFMAKHNIKRAPEDMTKAKPQTPYAHLNQQDDWKPYIVVRRGNGNGSFHWKAGCTHGLELVHCKDCFSSEKMVAKKRWCSGCFTTQLDRKRQEIGLCVACDDGKTKVARTEVRLREPLFQAVGFPPSAVDDTYFGTDGEVCDVDKPRRPDAPWLGTDRAVLCETDEHSHTRSNYGPECCATWASDMTEALVSLYRDQGLDGDALRVFLVRWNPDARDRSRPVIRQEDRARIVGERIKALREMPAEELAKFPPMVPIVLYYYYHSKAQRWICLLYTSPSPRDRG
mgnify:FL=1